jgi:hypothetical protein
VFEMSDTEKKSPSSCVGVFGDMDGAIVKQLQQLKHEGRLPVNLRIVHITGLPEGSAGVFQKKDSQNVSVSGEVTWPNVTEYQGQK